MLQKQVVSMSETGSFHIEKRRFSYSHVSAYSRVIKHNLHDTLIREFGIISELAH